MSADRNPSSQDQLAADPQLAVPPGARIWIAGHNSDAKLAAHEWLRNAVSRDAEASVQPAQRVTRPRSGPVDIALLAPDSPEEAGYFAAKVLRRLAPGGTIWIVRPMSSDTGFNGPHLEDSFGLALHARGFVPAARARLGEACMAYSFRSAGTLRPSL